jgi:(p)ppGpp synthase/HD superfamily hydrolase
VTFTECFSSRFDQALTLAALVHAGVPRKGTVIPYIMHPVHVARLLERHGFSEDVVIAGLLHDVLEDAEFGEAGLQIVLVETFRKFVGVARTADAFRIATKTFIAEEFSPTVLQLVQAVTELKTDGSQKRPWRQRKEEQLAHIRAMDRNAAALKAADALHNSRSVLRDLQRDGLETLRRFNCSTEDTLWYYRAVADGLREPLKGHPLHQELDDAVFELTEGVKGVSEPRMSSLPSLACRAWPPTKMKFPPVFRRTRTTRS